MAFTVTLPINQINYAPFSNNLNTAGWELNNQIDNQENIVIPPLRLTHTWTMRAKSTRFSEVCDFTVELHSYKMNKEYTKRYRKNSHKAWAESRPTTALIREISASEAFAHLAWNKVLYQFIPKGDLNLAELGEMIRKTNIYGQFAFNSCPFELRNFYDKEAKTKATTSFMASDPWSYKIGSNVQVGDEMFTITAIHGDTTGISMERTLETSEARTLLANICDLWSIPEEDLLTEARRWAEEKNLDLMELAMSRWTDNNIDNPLPGKEALVGYVTTHYWDILDNREPAEVENQCAMDPFGIKKQLVKSSCRVE